MLRIHHTYEIVIFKDIQCGYFSTYIDDQYEGVNKIMSCPSATGDNPRGGQPYGLTILYHLHQCRPCTVLFI